MSEELTGKQKLFVKYYLGEANLNASEAARLAGYNSPEKMGTRNMAKRLVREAIEKEMAKREKRIEITQDQIIEQLGRQAFYDIKDFLSFGPGGVKLKPSAEIDGKVVTEVRETRDGVTFKLADRTKSLELLMRHFGMLNDKLTATVQAEVTSNEHRTIEHKLASDPETRRLLAELYSSYRAMEASSED